MNILENINDEIIVVKAINEKKGEITEENIAFLDCDYSLIRFLSSQLSLKEVTLNNWNYPVIKQGDSITLLYRLVLQYYSKYDGQPCRRHKPATNANFKNCLSLLSTSLFPPCSCPAQVPHCLALQSRKVNPPSFPV